MSCDNGQCVKESLWCDATVDCSDASDEAVCGCRRRVDAVRLCDGYLDCPRGEDEENCHGEIIAFLKKKFTNLDDTFLGCEGGSEFSCVPSGNRDKNRVCLPTKKRCDGHEDCASGSDEEGCAVLLEELVNSRQVEMESHISGYLHVNREGHWLPVCDPDTASAIKACKDEVGTDVR